MWVNLVGIIALFAAVVGGATKFFGLDVKDSPLWVYIPLAIAAVCAVVWLAFNGKAIARLATSKSARYGVNMFALTLIVAFIIVMLNVVVTEQAPQWDTTQNQRNSLAPQSVQVVKGLSDDIMVTAIEPESVTPASARFTSAFNATMAMYRAASGRVNYRIVNAFANPQEVEDLPKPIAPGDIFVTCGTRHEKVEPYSVTNMEEKITRAIIAASQPQQKTVYFLTRRGEKLFEVGVGFSELRSALQAENYEVKTLNLLEEHEIPDDCSVLFIADPTYQFADSDLTALTQYIDRGGQVMACIDIEPVLNNLADSELVDYLKQFGCDVGRDVVIEQSIQDISLQGHVSMGISTTFQTASFSSTNDITKDLYDPIVVSVARSVTADDLPRGVTADKIASASRASWAEDNLELMLGPRGEVNPADSKIKESVPIAQVFTVDLTERPARFTPTAPQPTEGLPATLTLATPEAGASPEVAAPSEPLEVSPHEAEMSPSLDEPPLSPGGATEPGGRPQVDPSSRNSVAGEAQITPDPDPSSRNSVAGEEETTPAAATPEARATQARLIVIGDTTMLTDRYMLPGRTGNRDFILNAVNYLAAESNLIAIRPRDTINSGFLMTALDQRILIVLLILLPLAVALTGVIVAVRRRRLA